jgi:hypothetical protein
VPAGADDEADLYHDASDHVMHMHDDARDQQEALHFHLTDGTKQSSPTTRQSFDQDKDQDQDPQRTSRGRTSPQQSAKRGSSRMDARMDGRMGVVEEAAAGVIESPSWSPMSKRVQGPTTRRSLGYMMETVPVTPEY